MYSCGLRFRTQGIGSAVFSKDLYYKGPVNFQQYGPKFPIAFKGFTEVYGYN